MATHSVDIINSVGAREDCAVFRSDRLNKQTGGEELAGQSALLDDLSEWVDLKPFSAINFLASKRVLFYEGKSDGIILKKCADIMFRNSPKKKASFENWTLVALDGSGNEKMANLLARLVESNAFPNQHTLADFKVMIQLDKDYQSEIAALERLKSSEMPYYKNIWEKHSIESLFCEAETLYQWLKPSCPQLKIEIIQQAIDAANADDELNQYAREQRQITLCSPRNDANLKTSNRQAAQEVNANPEIWQHGKDRASFILRHIKTALGSSANNLTTALPKIIEKADVNQFAAGNPAVIPKAIGDLLNWMIQ